MVDQTCVKLYKHAEFLFTHGLVRDLNNAIAFLSVIKGHFCTEYFKLVIVRVFGLWGVLCGESYMLLSKMLPQFKLLLSFPLSSFLLLSFCPPTCNSGLSETPQMGKHEMFCDPVVPGTGAHLKVFVRIGLCGVFLNNVTWSVLPVVAEHIRFQGKSKIPWISNG